MKIDINHTWMVHTEPLCKGILMINTNVCRVAEFWLDRVPKKLKVSEWPAEFRVHSRDNSKNFLLKNFSKILKNARAHQQFRHKIDI